ELKVDWNFDVELTPEMVELVEWSPSLETIDINVLPLTPNTLRRLAALPRLRRGGGEFMGTPAELAQIEAEFPNLHFRSWDPKGRHVVMFSDTPFPIWP